MTKSIPINIPNKSKYAHTLACSLSLSASPKEIGKSLINHFCKLKASQSLPPAEGQFILEPIDEHMDSYRKGFEQRSQDTVLDFDQVIQQGFGNHKDKKDLTLKLSLTPKQIRNPCY